MTSEQGDGIAASPTHVSAQPDKSAQSTLSGAAAQSTLSDAAAPAASVPPRLLLAEDNPVNQKLAQTLLTRLGYQVSIAENGAMALEMFMAGEFDAVLMDMQMPIMDGLEATRRIRQWERRYADHRTLIIAMTANAMERDRDACLKAGMDEHLSKPISRQALAAILSLVRAAPTTSS